MIARAKHIPATLHDITGGILRVVPPVMGTIRAGLRGEECTNHAVHLRALMFLSRGPSTAGDVAEAFQVSLPTASKTISVLERNGWVARSRDPEDRRRVFVTLTSDGHAEMDHARETAEAHVAQLFEGVSQEELEKIHAGLVALEDVLRDRHIAHDMDPCDRRGSHAGRHLEK